MQFLVTEAVVCLGGSSELVKILNRLGIAISLDTYNRISTDIATERIRRGILSELVPSTLTVVSIDNIDILQRHAAVATSVKNRSWHGTTVQCVQPLPESSILCNEEKLASISTTSSPAFVPTSPVPCSHEPLPSQANVPECSSTAQLNSDMQAQQSSLGKHGISPLLPAQQLQKRKKIVPRSLPKSVLLASDSVESTSIGSTDFIFHESIDYIRPPLDGVSLQSFRMQPQEAKSFDTLDSALFQYFCLKEAKDEDAKLPGFSSFLSHECYCDDNEVGNIAYVDILSLPADSKDTIMKVLKKLFKTFVLEMRNKWLVVVGDAKTYDILQDVKREYGRSMEWVLPLPGDWHILFNYQKVIMKIYSDAGLYELAKKAGHRAETLFSCPC